MPTLAPRLFRMTFISISVPARKVSRMAPKPARKFTQGVISRPMVLPAMAPTTISMSATEMATRMEIIDAASASASQTDEASQTLCMLNSSVSEAFAPPGPDQARVLA